MARRIHSRYKISGTLIAQSPIHVGGLGGNADTDLALAIDGEGQYYFPGTSLAGALRAWMEEIDTEITNCLWGEQEEDSDQGHASFILIEDAVINCQNMTIEIRDGVAIDRHWGTAVDKMKFDRAILPKGVKIPLDITLERDDKLSEDQWNDYQFKFAQLLNSLKNGHISLGAAKTRGLGRVKLYEENWQIQEQKLLYRQGMLDCLLRGGESVDWSSLFAQNNSFSPAQLDIEIHWEPLSPVMVKAEADGIAVDILPLVSSTNGGVTFVLPGSSIKGSLRSQAERIYRTVCGQNTPDKFSEQIELDLINTLFGSAAHKNKELGYLGSLGVDDCFAKVPLTSASWATIEQATETPILRQALRDSPLEHTQQAFHVAIDRWTGGAADSFLYSVLEPMGFSWEPINLRLNLKRLKHPAENNLFPCIALLLLTLRDLMKSRIPLGFATNRGLGAIEVTQIKFKGTGQLSELEHFQNVTLTESDFSQINQDFLNNLNTQWQQWLERRNNVHC